MRCFYLVRSEDATGVSGTGRVAQGVEFDHGRVALAWMTLHRSIVIYDCIKEVETIHGHDGKTTVEWVLSEE